MKPQQGQRRRLTKGCVWTFGLAIVVTALRGLGLSASASATANGAGVVRAAMFWSDSCPHCHHVIDNVLPPMQERYGDRLQIHLIEVATASEFQRVAQVASAYGIPRNQVGVPFLVIGDRALIGSNQIPEELPGLIERHLDAGGVDYPDVAALTDVLPDEAASTPETAPEKSTEEASSSLPPISETMDASREGGRPSGFWPAIAVLIGMALAVGYAGVRLWRRLHDGLAIGRRPWAERLVVPLAIAGLGVASYLAYVETAAVPAVCGPVGDCNAVQNSPYATLFGVVPVGVLGLIGYAAMLAVWLWGRRSASASDRVSLAVFAMASGGVLFSIYLTYLEPFVIGAVCAWCLTSAVIMTMLLLCTLDPALRAVPQRRG